MSGTVGLITGSSHLTLATTARALRTTRAGMWGGYAGAPLPELAMAEGGQASTGAALQWARTLFGGGGDAPPSLAQLDAEAAALPVGAEGVLALESFQGARTPVTDPLARGALLGLSLHHGRGHVWRALLEAVCLGSRATVEALLGGERPTLVLLTGGIARSPFWLQMHADALGAPVAVVEESVLLGGGCLAAAASGLHPDLDSAVDAMVREARRVHPDPQASARYDLLYRLYLRLAPTIAPISHELASGDSASGEPPSSDASASATIGSDLASPKRALPQERALPPQRALPPKLASGREALVVPSLLAADGAELGLVARQIESVAHWVHVDIFDGSHVSNYAISALAPSTAAMLRSRAPGLLIDAHLGVLHPQRHLAELAQMGAHRITFQYEARVIHYPSLTLPESHIPKSHIPKSHKTPISPLLSKCQHTICSGHLTHHLFVPFV